MIIADKIILLRKKNGWSQEELADKINVSRQSVSKWEGAQTVPDLDKILLLSRLFGVTTDYLIKDELEDEQYTDETDEQVKKVTLAQANAFLQWRETAARKIAFGVVLCILSPILLILLAALSELPTSPISENAAAAIGLIALLLIVAAAVATFVRCGFQNTPYDFLEEEPFETEYGVAGMVRQKQKDYRPTYTRQNILGVCILVLSPVPLFGGFFTEDEVWTVGLLCVTMAVAAVGVALLVYAGVRWASMQKLLKEGDYTPAAKKRNRIVDAVSVAYWATATAIYLAWSFLFDAWEITWVVWPIAGVFCAAVIGIAEAAARAKDKD